MTDIFNCKALVDQFGQTKAYMTPTGEIKDLEGYSTSLRIELDLSNAGFSAGDTTHLTTIGSMSREGIIKFVR